jgi:hypothetical protein
VGGIKRGLWQRLLLLVLVLLLLLLLVVVLVVVVVVVLWRGQPRALLPLLLWCGTLLLPPRLLHLLLPGCEQQPVQGAPQPQRCHIRRRQVTEGPDRCCGGTRGEYRRVKRRV